MLQQEVVQRQIPSRKWTYLETAEPSGLQDSDSF
jgi:hypothetical protein